MKQITNWLVTQRGHIRGDVLELEKSIETSRVVSREGNIVTTKSGSQYELAEPHPYLDDSGIRAVNWPGVESPLEAVDKAIERNAKRQRQ